MFNDWVNVDDKLETKLNKKICLLELKFNNKLKKYNEKLNQIMKLLNNTNSNVEKVDIHILDALDELENIKKMNKYRPPLCKTQLRPVLFKNKI